MSQATQPGDRYRRVGGALYGRLALLLADEVTARRAADELFVRFMTRSAAAAAVDAAVDETSSASRAASPSERRAEWAWIYRVATNDALQRLPDDAVPALATPASASVAVAPPARRAPPSMRELRRFDELDANTRVLLDLDGLSEDELVEVLGTLPARVRKAVASRLASGPGEHPSRLRLEAEPETAAVVAHVASCDDCARALALAQRRRQEFARRIGPAEVERMAAAIRAARPRGPLGAAGRRRVAQAAVVTASLLAVCALALLVARPQTLPRGEVPYAGLKGASRVKASGIQITVRRDETTRALDPETQLRVGDRLLFRVRTERPRFLELRAKQAGSAEVRLFPGDAPQALLVNPGQALDRGFDVTTATGAIGITARFADHPFPVDQPPGPDVEVVPVRIRGNPATP